ncbi:fimbrial biogenesis chaperone [Dongshaea marina]|uniref:fimbrial biogenesis chaperone n=1 Tax=Dongshaea marina TaxID=2047966 RepID=UPI000D3E946B|nr:fimbria/pilus periplasmic chaperone [Dongshaea marina]
MLRYIYAITAGIFWLNCTVAQAGSYGVSPTLIKLQNSQRQQSLSVTNVGNKPIALQVAVYKWQIENGKDKLTAAPEFFASPAMLHVAPQTTQTVRLGYFSYNSTKQIQTYRVLLKELPDQVKPTKDEKNNSQVVIYTDTSVPLYVYPKNKPISDYRWSQKLTAKGLQLTLNNVGGTVAKVAGIELGNKATLIKGQKILTATKIIKTFKYVLPGQTQSWLVPGAKQVFKLLSPKIAGEDKQSIVSIR